MQAWESMVIAVRRNPFTSTFYCERGPKRIGDKIAINAAGSAEAVKDLPMAGAGLMSVQFG